MSKVELTVHPFEMGTYKEAALKPLEEAAEVYGAWQALGETKYGDFARVVKLGAINVYEALTLTHLANEIADCIQACVNLAARYDIDLTAAMGRCYRSNYERGRYSKLEEEPMSEDAKRVLNRLLDASAGEGDD